MAEAVPYVRISGLFAQLPARALNIVGGEVKNYFSATLTDSFCVICHSPLAFCV